MNEEQAHQARERRDDRNRRIVDQPVTNLSQLKTYMNAYYKNTHNDSSSQWTVLRHEIRLAWVMWYHYIPPTPSQIVSLLFADVTVPNRSYEVEDVQAFVNIVKDAIKFFYDGVQDRFAYFINVGRRVTNAFEQGVGNVHNTGALRRRIGFASRTVDTWGLMNMYERIHAEPLERLLIEQPIGFNHEHVDREGAWFNRGYGFKFNLAENYFERVERRNEVTGLMEIVVVPPLITTKIMRGDTLWNRRHGNMTRLANFREVFYPVSIRGDMLGDRNARRRPMPRQDRPRRPARPQPRPDGPVRRAPAYLDQGANAAGRARRRAPAPAPPVVNDRTALFNDIRNAAQAGRLRPTRTRNRTAEEQIMLADIRRARPDAARRRQNLLNMERATNDGYPDLMNDIRERRGRPRPVTADQRIDQAWQGGVIGATWNAARRVRNNEDNSAETAPGHWEDIEFRFPSRGSKRRQKRQARKTVTRRQRVQPMAGTGVLPNQRVVAPRQNTMDRGEQQRPPALPDSPVRERQLPGRDRPRRNPPRKSKNNWHNWWNHGKFD